jgi:hypothetical protein
LSATNRALAITIAQTLDGYPLALDQAGAYLLETGCGLATYFEQYQLHRAALLGRRGQKKLGHADPLTITLGLTLAKVTRQHPVYLHLLRLLAFLQSDGIPYELLSEGASAVSRPLRSLLSNSIDLHQALADLHSYSILQYQTDATLLQCHRLVQAVLIDNLTRKQQRQWATQAMLLINSVFPEALPETWDACERYRKQAQHCATLITTYQLTLTEGAALLQRLGSYCRQQASLTEAETYLLQALQLYEAQTVAYL